jgi:stage V sporulation protein S
VEVLRIAADSSPKSIAGALTAILKEESFVELQAVGAGAVNQAVKAIAIARGYIAPNGINIIMIPAFVEIDIDGDERTAIRFIVEPR